MTDERTSESDTGGADIDPRLDPAPVFGDGPPAVHPGHPALRRALDHAPDRGSEPDDELRQAIRSFAHESVAPSLPSGRTGLLGRRAGEGATGLEARTRARRSRLLRNLIVAAVLVVIVAMVTWHREPGPGNGRPAATAPDAAVPSVAPPTPAASASAAVATAQAPASAAGAPALSEAEKILFAPRVTLPESASTAASAAAAKAPKVMTPSTAPAPATPSATPTPTTPPAAQPKTSVASLPSTPAPVPGMSPGAAAERAKVAAASAAATATPVTPASPATTPTGRAAASFAAPGGTSVAPGNPVATPSTVAKPAAEAAAPPAPPTFAALSQWTQLTMTRADGTTRRRSKADARELGALLSSAALAGGGAEPIKGRVDWRVNLERNGQTIARVELAGNQVRWIENNAAPGTGTPPPGSLDSVREMLENVFEEPASGAASKPAPGVPVEVQNR
jgi:hypothetical protein